jgi:hypothetical protein
VALVTQPRGRVATLGLGVPSAVVLALLEKGKEKEKEKEEKKEKERRRRKRRRRRRRRKGEGEGEEDGDGGRLHLSRCRRSSGPVHSPLQEGVGVGPGWGGSSGSHKLFTFAINCPGPAISLNQIGWTCLVYLTWTQLGDLNRNVSVHYLCEML